eukprot:CAMPEP_0178922998 /NCGR_PEP_ID=MMETSP0786-20121207/16473_1 /TAXON_ID=186022 /ORGANISM="Thalassionema frauenfeldii, Strain CCMP 1798" /LENGTH=492 /DNA_ID=CAMNT_0020597441 /DNA_START=110 /DNA_END=1588 /DNA_ORIENTATION=-
MLGSTRQLRPRGNKDNLSNNNNNQRENENAVSKRRVFGEISNQHKTSDGNAKAQKRASLKRKAAVVVNNLRRSTRSNNVAANQTDKSDSLEKGSKRRKVEGLKQRVDGQKRMKTRSHFKIAEVPDEIDNHADANATEAINTGRPRTRSQRLRTKIVDDSDDRKETAETSLLEQSRKRTKEKAISKKLLKDKEKSNTEEKEGTREKRGRATSRSKSRKQKRRVKSEPRSLCSDFLVESNFTLVRYPFDPSKYTTGISDYDKNTQADTLEVSNYVTDIYQRLYYNELRFQPDMYMEEQEEINSTMRAILIDWLVEVHMKFKLAPDTLYLCVNIIDRYCSVMNVPRRKLQLVGVTALLLACKYEEIYPPEVRDCVYITDRAYTRQDVLDMEQDIVNALEFKLTVPTGFSFLVRYLFVLQASDLAKAAANYYMERTLQEYEFIVYRQSLVAAAAVCLALNNPHICASDGRGKKKNISAGFPSEVHRLHKGRSFCCM